ncbi:MAG: hypothetical protein ACOWWR_02130 [Eubacteriales bacterium]
MSKEKTIEEIMDEVKNELDFLPPDLGVREGFMAGLTFIMIL